MSTSNGATDYETRRKKAIERCKEQIQWYDKHAAMRSFYYRFFQTCAVIFGSITPLLIISNIVSRPLQALISTLSAICIGLLGFYQWQQDWIRFATTCEFLKSELIKFETRTSPYNESKSKEEALDKFVQETENLALVETTTWRLQQLRQNGQYLHRLEDINKTK